MFNKKAQIGETITWIVATIVIIVILSFSIFIVSFNLKNKNFELKTESDLISTKSISSFLNEDLNIELIKNSVESDNYDDFEKKFKPFLENLTVVNGIGGWNLELYVNGKKKFDLPTSNYNLGYSDYYETDFEFESLGKKIILKFWEDCYGTCQ
jgi:hypothetical protein